MVVDWSGRLTPGTNLSGSSINRVTEPTHPVIEWLTNRMKRPGQVERNSLPARFDEACATELRSDRTETIRDTSG
jgi:hypothetical protein